MAGRFGSNSLLGRAPSAEGRVVVRFCDDGAIAEAGIGAIILFKLVVGTE